MHISNPQIIWRRIGADWVLFKSLQPFARIVRDGHRWLCYRAGERDDESFMGPALSLSTAKAYLIALAARSR